MAIAIDLFAGGGGASSGIEDAGYTVIAAVNHDKYAVAMHKENHPRTKHYREDIFTVDPISAAQGRHIDLLWASPDCRHFSRAKGAALVDRKIRGLAWVILRWAMDLHPNVILGENVPEFKTWGPITKEGKIIKDLAGQYFEGFIMMLTSGIPAEHPALKEAATVLSIRKGSKKWNQLVKGLGYVFDSAELAACDYGAPTSRNRLYFCARCDGQSIVWPKPTHGDPARRWWKGLRGSPMSCKQTLQRAKNPLHPARKWQASLYLWQKW